MRKILALQFCRHGFFRVEKLARLSLMSNAKQLKAGLFVGS